jgi:O-antigen ligase
LIFVYFCHAPLILLIPGILAMAGIVVLSWWKILWSLGCFIVCIPLISGLHVVGVLPAPLASFWFAGIYLSWFVKRVFWHKKAIASQVWIGNLIDILSAIVLLSLVVTILQYPLDYAGYRMLSYERIRQDDPMFCVFAAFILLQGLFFYRMLEMEVRGKEILEWAIPVFYMHAVTIISFSLLQVIFNIPAKHKKAILFSPFGDVHAWGSYVVLLFFLFLGLSFVKGKTHKLRTLFAGFFFCLILLSSSASTVAALVITGSIFVACKFGARWFMVFSGVILAGLLFINLYPSILEKSDNYLIQRYAKRLSVKTIIHPGSPLTGRYMSADQALGIIREYPLTGSGIGTFYRISRYYHYSDTPRPGRIENAHNYYLQFTAELGIPALLLFLSIIFCVYRAGVRAIPRYGEYDSFITGLLFGLSAYLITMLTGHPLILSNQQFLFWFVIAVISIEERGEERGQVFISDR